MAGLVPAIHAFKTFQQDVNSAAMTISLRPARTADIPAITRIYAHAVEHGTASFELTPPDQTEMARRMNDLVGRGNPYIAA